MINEQYIRENILFETEESAQAKLDIDYPGYKVTVSEKGYTEITDNNGKIVAKLSATVVDFNSVGA